MQCAVFHRRHHFQGSLHSLEDGMLKAVHRWENDSASAGIPEIHCTMVGMQLSCSSSTYWLVLFHWRSPVAQQTLCNRAKLSLCTVKNVQQTHSQVWCSFPNWVSLYPYCNLGCEENSIYMLPGNLSQKTRMCGKKNNPTTSQTL